MSKTIFLNIIILSLLSNSSFSNNSQDFRRHFLILYDNSGTFFTYEKDKPEIRKTLVKLFLNQIPASNGNKNNLNFEKQNNTTFFDPIRDEVSFFWFGLNQQNTSYLEKNKLQLYFEGKLDEEFQERLINFQESTWSKSNLIAIEDFLESFKRPPWGNGYTFSNYAYPLVLEDLENSGFASEYVIIIISDFLSGSDFGNKQDKERLYDIFGRTEGDQRFVQSIVERWESLENKFYEIGYFEFEFPTNKTDDSGNPVILGILGYKLRPNAGFYQPENVFIKLNSDIDFTQESYLSSKYTISETIISFLHGKDLRTTEIVLTIQDNNNNYLHQGILTTLENDSLVTKNNKLVKMDGSNMNYIIPEVTIDLDSVFSKEDLWSSPFYINFLFKTEYSIGKDKAIKLTYSASRTFTENNFKFQTQIKEKIMEYSKIAAIPITSLLIIWFIIWNIKYRFLSTHLEILPAGGYPIKELKRNIRKEIKLSETVDINHTVVTLFLNCKNSIKLLLYFNASVEISDGFVWSDNKPNRRRISTIKDNWIKVHRSNNENPLTLKFEDNIFFMKSLTTIKVILKK